MASGKPAQGSSQRLVLGQQACKAKSNEITAIPLLLERLALTGALVALDARETQTKIAQATLDCQSALKGGSFRTCGEVTLVLFRPGRGVGSGGLEHLLAQQVEACASIHAALDQLETVVLPLDLPVAPGLRDCGLNSCLVLTQTIGEAAQPRFGRGRQPGVQASRVVLLQQSGEAAHEVRGNPQVRRGRLKRLDKPAFSLVQRRRLGRQQPCGPARRGDVAGQDLCGSSARSPPCGPTADDVVAALEAASLQGAV